MVRKRITLALQGGGSHGAYTWGVLDRLLEEDDLEIEGISGASAGAMNAAVLAHGLAVGGREGARQALNAFWQGVSRGDVDGAVDGAAAATIQAPPAAAQAYLLLSRFFSPYQLNPLNVNPLRDLLAEQIDFERLRASSIKLFIATTRASSATLRVFTTRELTLDVLLASACLPSIHRGVEIEGEAYWDGALVANPPLGPLVQECAARDMVMVVVNPERDSVPSTPEGISQRLTEISFNAAFAAELGAIERAKQEAARALLPLGRLDRRLRQLNLHTIDSGRYMAELDVHSRFNTDAAFIAALRDEGRRCADSWCRGLAHSSPRGSTPWLPVFGPEAQG